MSNYICTMYAPWFGALPFCTNLFLYCCSLSKNILWIIHSDQDEPKKYENIIWIKIDRDISDRVKRVFDECPKRNWGHKLCDLKPWWHIIFNEGFDFEYRGWIDWDVVHNLSKLEFNFESAKFSLSPMAGPLYIQRNITLLDLYPVAYKNFLAVPHSTAFDELVYLKNIDSTILQQGMTPEVDLTAPPEFALHMYRAKTNQKLFSEWLTKYAGNLHINFAWAQ